MTTSVKSISVDDADKLKPIPAVVLKLYDECAKDALDIRKIIELIECEPAVASKILSVANSPLYGCSREIDTIQRATIVLGARAISEIAVSFAAKEVFESGPSSPAKQSLLEHSLGTAVVAKKIADGSEHCDPNAAFLTGMMHDIGKLVFLNVIPAEYSAQKESQVTDTLDAEKKSFGVNHVDIGLRYLQNMGLPAEINQAVANHHCLDAQPNSLAGIASIANRLAKIWGLGCPPNDEAEVQPERDETSFQPDEYLDYFEPAQQEYESLKCIFQS